MSFFPNNWHTFAGELDFLAVLCSSGDSDLSLSKNGEFHFFIHTKNCFNWANSDSAVEVLFSADEDVL